MNEPNPKAFREYAAMQFYRMDCVKMETIPVRWGVLREDLRNKYLRKADEQVGAWAAEEEAARQRRNAGDPRSFFTPPRA